VIFSEGPRTDRSIAAHRESSFAFLDRVDDPVFEEVRVLIEAWFGRYAQRQPIGSTRNLANRLRNKRDLQFESGFWELYLHELHLRLGFEVEANPSVGSGRTPDFRMTRGQERFYLEATLIATDPLRLSDGPALAAVFDWVDAAFDPDFVVSLDIARAGRDTPSKQSVVAGLEKWLAGLDWAPLHACLERGDRVAMPETQLPAGEWLLAYRAYPRPAARRGDRSYRTLALYPVSGAFCGSGIASAVATKVREKGRRYERLDAPLIVALRVMSMIADREDILAGLMEIPEAPWRANTGSRAGYVSAVLAVTEFGYPAVGRKLPDLYLNAEAGQEFGNGVGWPEVGPGRDGSAQIKAGTFLPDRLFEISDDWPGRPFEWRHALAS